MRICVLNTKVQHAIPRTLAFAKYFEEVHFIQTSSLNSGKYFKNTDIIYHRIGRKGDRFVPLKLVWCLRKIKPDLIICHYLAGDHYYSAIMANKCPVVGIAMGGDILFDEGSQPPSIRERKLIKRAVQQTAYIAAKSKTLEDRLYSFHTKALIETNYWGLDFAKFTPGNKYVSRKKLGLPLRSLIILSPRTWAPHLNIDKVVEAFSIINFQLSNAKLVMIGHKPISEYTASVKEKITKLGIQDKVVIRNYVEYMEMVDYYRAADVIVSLGRSEGFPTTVLEALACQKPVVVGRIPQISEIITDKREALLCNFTPNDIAAKVIDLLKDKKLANYIAKNGRKKVKEVADIEINAKKFAKSVRDIAIKQKNNKFIEWVTFTSFFLFDYFLRLIIKVINKIKSNILQN